MSNRPADIAVTRGKCYKIEDFDGEVTVKVNTIDLLRKELNSKHLK